ncbi:5'-nucleotidase [Dactylosporangium sp. NPDC049525]|uniref:5'-nucleotidase n=1 Tax=Dactylosporangium sp. NPDC049525 TaxID=3154730 RepID=UPI00341A00F1
MAYDLDNCLVVGIASSALFDLKESDEVFRRDGEEAYRRYQEENLNNFLAPGIAFPFIKRLLSLNDLCDAGEHPLVEVIILSRNDPDTGLRVMRSVKHHELAITRAIFMQGKSPYKFMPAFHMSLFLSADERDVKAATRRGFQAGQVLPSQYVDDEDRDLRIAFDFDGVLAGDDSERVMQSGGLEAFYAYERANAGIPHSPGPLQDFLRQVNQIQRREEAKKAADEKYRVRLHVSIVTARNAPAHERAVDSLKTWGVTVNDAFFLGGVDKGKVVEILKPHIFFDDQPTHLLSTSRAAPSVHIPFGVVNDETGAAIALTEPPEV